MAKLLKLVRTISGKIIFVLPECSTMCMPGTGVRNGVSIGAGVRFTDVWPLPLPAEPNSSRLCWDVSLAEQDASTPPETFQEGCCGYSHTGQNKVSKEVVTYLSCHYLGEFGRVFESKLNYFFLSLLQSSLKLLLWLSMLGL
jgi:hypothetical protein